MSAVCTWLGRVLRSAQVLPPSSDTKIGAVVLAGPPGFGVKAEAARMLGLDANVVRKGSASCHVSPLSDAGIMSTTRTPGRGGGGGEGAPSGWSWGRRQAAMTKMTAARRVVARMVRGYTRGGPRVRGPHPRSFATRACRASKAGPFAERTGVPIDVVDLDRTRADSERPKTEHDRRDKMEGEAAAQQAINPGG